MKAVGTKSGSSGNGAVEAASVPVATVPAAHEADRPVRLSAEELQAIARAVADPRRFEILKQIAACGNLLCGDLHAQQTISPATISHHLKELQEAGLVEVERVGRSMKLWLRRPVWDAYLEYLRQL